MTGIPERRSDGELLDAYSEAVTGTTRPEFGDPATPGESLRTQWEETNAAVFTNDVNEYP